MSPPYFPYLAVLFLALSTTACGSVPKEVRSDDASAFLASTQEKACRLLADRGSLTLEDCVQIALENNLDLKVAEVSTRLAKLDRAIAFAAFLPKLDMQFDATGLSEPPILLFGGGEVQITDQHVQRLALSAQQPVFLPQAWSLYEARKRGEDISGLVLERTRQMISLRVTVLYFSCLTVQQTESFLLRSVEQSRELLAEVRCLEGEGMVTPAEREQLETLLLSHEREVSRNRHAFARTKAELLGAMGISPLAHVELAQSACPFPVDRRELPDLVLSALLHRPELHVADRTIEIRREETRMAIAAFLPKIFGLGGFFHTSDSFLKYRDVWSYGISGVLSVFDGFANVHEYKSAKERRTAAVLEREQTCMRIILEVVRAYLNVQEAGDQVKLAERTLQASERRLVEVESQRAEGMVRPSAFLEAVAGRDRARARLSAARWNEQISAATLLAVTDGTRIER